MNDTTSVSQMLADQIGKSDTQWSLGTFGAIAEFSRDHDEPVVLTRSDGRVTAVTQRGGVRIEAPDGVVLTASESPTKEGWSQRVALCMPSEACAMNRRAALAEIGPDEHALRDADRGSILFDLGLGALQADICVRIATPSVVAALRDHVGRSLFEPGNPAVGIIFADNPHRVFTSRAGRIEVYQPIPPAHGVSPEGPHTHLLPALLKHGRTHAATEPVPAGLVPCAHFYPAHAAKDERGQVIAFDSARHAAFQALLAVYGMPDGVALKRRVMAAIENGEAPFPPAELRGRFERACVRVALRQLKAANRPLPALPGWLAAFERADQPFDAELIDVYAHS